MVLFLTKKRHSYGRYGYVSTGLRNSAQLVVDMLVANGIAAQLVSVADNNDIDREVTKYRPDVVVIEALWVVPEKFKVLHKLHPNVKWIIRGHSDIPFLANEGIAIDWLFEYLWMDNVYIGFNSPRITEDFRALVSPHQAHRVLYLPNYYPIHRYRTTAPYSSVVRVGCFGAVRPLKNQLLQAVAAIRFADKIGKTLFFHINGTRCEQGGESILKNLRALFEHSPHMLVEHQWLTREDLLERLQNMDFALAVSLSETFCITAADAVSQGVPLICSSEVPWATDLSVVPATDSTAVAARLHQLNGLKGKIVSYLNQYNLRKYSKKSRQIWRKELHKLTHCGLD